MSANYAVDVPAESASVRDGQYQVEVTHDVRIQTDDPDVTLSGDLYRPVATVSVPALVMVLPYRKDAGGGGVDSATFRWFAERGYACLLVDFLGTGSSDGTHRPPFHENDADDGVAAVEWAAAQPWCDGNVGMWGHSYGAFMSLSTAARRPPHLKAIVPVMSPLDPERDLVYPAGAPRIEAVASWGVHTLLNQVLPPLRDYASEAEQRRWRQRLTGARPWILDMFQTGPGDPACERELSTRPPSRFLRSLWPAGATSSVTPLSAPTSRSTHRRSSWSARGCTPCPTPLRFRPSTSARYACGGGIIGWAGRTTVSWTNSRSPCTGKVTSRSGSSSLPGHRPAP